MESLKTPHSKISGNARPVNLELMVAHRVLKLEHLHLGYWEPGEPLSHENFKVAQRRFLEKFFAHIPDGTSSILDVGCGTGGGSRMLHEAGYQVEAVSPDPYQKMVFQENNSATIPFHACKFETFKGGQHYDLVLFSESSQYIKLDELFSGCRRILAPDGKRSVLVTDWFLHPGERYHYGVHDASGFLERAKQEGFTLQVSEDITDRTVPSMEYMSTFHEEHVVPALEVAREFVQARAPFWSGLARLFLGRRLARVQQYLGERLHNKFDPKGFQLRGRYMIYLFNLDGK